MKNSGVILINDGDEQIVKYNPKMWLPKRYFGDKFSTYWPETPIVLQFMLAMLILIRKGSLNTISSFQHCVLQHWFESRELNTKVLLIH